MNQDNLKYAIGSTLYIMGVFVSIMIILELFVLQIPFSINGFRIHMIGFPWLTEQVADATGFWRMPDYSQQFPNVYFLNYGEALIGALIFAFVGRTRKHHSDVLNIHTTLSRIGLAGTILSMGTLLYFWITLTVLWNTYVLGNVIYYPYPTPPPPPSWYAQFGLPLSMKAVPYYGGIYGFSTFGIAPITADMALLATAGLLFLCILSWKYFCVRRIGQ